MTLGIGPHQFIERRHQGITAFNYCSFCSRPDFDSIHNIDTESEQPVTTPSKDLAPGTVIEIGASAGLLQPLRYTLNSLRPADPPYASGWNVTDNQDPDDGTAWLAHASIDAGYTIVGGSVEATVGLGPIPAAQLEPGMIIESRLGPDREPGRYTLTERYYGAPKPAWKTTSVGGHGLLWDDDLDEYGFTVVGRGFTEADAPTEAEAEAALKTVQPASSVIELMDEIAEASQIRAEDLPDIRAPRGAVTFPTVERDLPTGDFRDLPDVIYIRATHPSSFRSGQWAYLSDIVMFEARPCFKVTFIDGATDTWVIYDRDAHYQFSLIPGKVIFEAP